MIPNPNYATDAQLRGMAQGGLPGAINEEITRLAMRRGAQVNPQAQQPGPPQRKLSTEEMIDDFVTRVRGKNAQSRQSIVPAGTPMPQEQQPQQPQQPAPQGIKAFATGGVNINYGRGPSDPRDSRFQGRMENGYILPNPSAPPTAPAGRPPVPMVTYDPNGYSVRGEPRTAIPKGPLMPPQQNIPAFNKSIQDAWARSQASGGLEAAAFPTPDDAFNWQRAYGGSAESSSGPEFPDLPPEVKLGKLPDRVQMPDFKPGAEYVDPFAEADRAIEKGSDRIAAARKPYDAAIRETRGDLEENKRKSFFRAMIDAGVAAMQAGGPSRDPASGDFMSIAGASIGQYVQSLDKDKEYQQRLKDKIASYNIAGSESELRVEDAFRQMGVQNASQQNQRNGVLMQAENNYNIAKTSSETDQRGQDINYAVVGAQLAGQMRGQNIDVVLKRFAAEESAKGGVDPKLALQAATEAASRAAEVYKEFVSSDTFRSSTGDARAKMLEEAQAQYVGIYAQNLHQNMLALGVPLEFGSLLGKVQSDSRGIAAATTVKPDTNNPRAPGIASTRFPSAPSQTQAPKGNILGDGYLR